MRRGGIMTMCNRCGGTGRLARSGRPVRFVPCTRCSGHGGHRFHLPAAPKSIPFEKVIERLRTS